MSNCPNHLARNTKWLFTSSACTLQWADLMIETEASPWGSKTVSQVSLKKKVGSDCHASGMSPKAHALKAWSTVCGATDRWQSETVGQKSLGAPPWRGTWGHLFLSCSQPLRDAQKQRNQMTMAWNSWIIGPKQNPFQMLTACEHHCNGKLTAASTNLQRESEWSGWEHAWVLLAEVTTAWSSVGGTSLGQSVFCHWHNPQIHRCPSVLLKCSVREMASSAHVLTWTASSHHHKSLMLLKDRTIKNSDS